MALGGGEVVVALSKAWSRIVIGVEGWWGSHLALAALNFHVWHIPSRQIQHMMKFLECNIRLPLTSLSEGS